MKKIYGGILVLLFSSISVSAYQQPSDVSEFVIKMQQRLRLTPDQVMAVTPIVEKYSFKYQEHQLNLENRLAAKATLRRIKKLKEEEKQELSQVLSMDQLNKWIRMQKEKRRS
jgi:hypothetical protein